MAAVNYKLIKNFFSKEELNILKKYCYNKLDLNKDYTIYDGTSFCPSWYNDPLMTSFLETKLTKVEKESNLKLFPTYAYWRYYVFGATLKKHSDRPACEISITDAVIYAGCDQKHWRPGVYEGEGMAQVFFHYVNQNGPNKNHAYDKINKK